MSTPKTLHGLTIKAQIILVFDLATSALNRAAEWSGWSGRSVKDHVEDVQSAADAASAAVLENSEAINDLVGRIEALEKGVGHE